MAITFLGVLILAVTLVTCCMETCMFMRCKEGKLGKGRPFYVKMWTCCSSVLVRLSGMNMPKFLEPCPRYCRSIWHSKTRIAHIRKKFALQRNFHKQQDDFLDERQVLLHRVKFKPQSIINSKNNLIEDVSRAQLQSLLATISTDRSQLERIVRKELEVENEIRRRRIFSWLVLLLCNFFSPAVSARTRWKQRSYNLPSSSIVIEIFFVPCFLSLRMFWQLFSTRI